MSKRFYIHSYAIPEGPPSVTYCTDYAEKVQHCVCTLLSDPRLTARIEILNSDMILPLLANLPVDLDA